MKAFEPSSRSAENNVEPAARGDAELNRKAPLIGNPGEKGRGNFLAGVARDLKNYENYLQSPLGGSWYRQEISVLDNPSRADVRRALIPLRTANYSFVLFSGHGYFSDDNRDTIVCLSGDEELEAVELRRGSGRQTVVLDCCRVVEKVALAEDSVAKVDRSPRSLDANDCRRYFDQEISKCPVGLVVMHACDVNETAADDSRRGGYYASNLINVAEDWAKSDTTDLSKKYNVLRVPDVHDRAAERVSWLSSGRQNPQIEKPKATSYFPFSIVA